ncbi:MAG: P1 family peptidase [Chloroflexota bacterium]
MSDDDNNGNNRKRNACRPRPRDAGIVFGVLPTGAHNAITDVEGVAVGHVTVSHGEGKLVPGKGPARTGVTAILPHRGNLFRQPVAAAYHVMNGFGKTIGLPQVGELGTIETPILLTNTLNVGLVADGLVEYMIRTNPDIGITAGSVNPLVGECNDGWLNDIQGRHVKPEHAIEAITRATGGPVAEGAVGAGTGMSCFEFKGGIGTASRVVEHHDGRFTVGCLVLSNFGGKQELTIVGVPVGRELAARPEHRPEDGSIIIVLATDAPLTDRQLGRIARRAPFGLARTGSTCGHGSGDFAIAFATTEAGGQGLPGGARRVMDSSPALGLLFKAAIEATEEAIINSLFAAETTVGRDGHVREALPVDETLAILRRYGRL